MQAHYYCPTLTALHEDGSFDEEAQHELYDRLIASGIDGAIVLGSSGEFYAMSYQECQTIGLDAIRHIDGRMEVYVGTGRMNVSQTVSLSNEMIDAGATGVIVVGPYYMGVSPEGVRTYYDEVAKAVRGNILIYNYPDRTGYDVAPVLPDLARSNPNIIGVKDTVESATHTQAIIRSLRQVRPDFKVYSGFDNNLAPVVLAGGTGVIAALSNVAPEMCARWVRALRSEDFGEVARIHEKVCDLMGVYTVATPFMSLMKHILGLQGMKIRDFVRLPALRASGQELDYARKVVKEIEGECHVA